LVCEGLFFDNDRDLDRECFFLVSDRDRDLESFLISDRDLERVFLVKDGELERICRVNDGGDKDRRQDKERDRRRVFDCEEGPFAERVFSPFVSFTFDSSSFSILIFSFIISLSFSGSSALSVAAKAAADTTSHGFGSMQDFCIFLVSFSSLMQDFSTFFFFSFGLVLYFAPISSSTFVALFSRLLFFRLCFFSSFFCFFFFFLDFGSLSRSFSSVTFISFVMRSFFILTSDGTASVVEPNDENISSKIWSADFISSVILFHSW